MESDETYKRYERVILVGDVTDKMLRLLREQRRREEIIERIKKMPPVQTETRTRGTVAAGCSRENGETAVPQGKSTARPTTTDISCEAAATGVRGAGGEK